MSENKFNISRREFIIKTIFASSAVVLPSYLSGNSFGENTWPGDYSFEKISNVIDLKDFTNKIFDKRINKDEFAYTIFWISRNAWHKRANLIFSKRNVRERSYLDIKCERNATPAGAGESRTDIVYEYITSGSVLYNPQNLSFPSAWTFESNLMDLKNEKLFKEVSRKGEGRVMKDTIIIKEGGKRKSYFIESGFPVIFKWMFIDFIQTEIQSNSKFPIMFNVIDELDIPVGVQSLSFSHQIELEFQGLKQKLFAYKLMGDAIIPTIYWLNESGRVFLVLTGLEAYFLD